MSAEPEGADGVGKGGDSKTLADVRERAAQKFPSWSDVQWLLERYESLRHALWTYGRHQQFCHYESPEFDHVGTQQTSGTPCNCGFHAALEASQK